MTQYEEIGDPEAFVSDLVKSRAYFVVMVEGGTEWHFVLRGIGKEFFGRDQEGSMDFGVLIHDGPPFYWMKRERVSNAEVARRLGVTIKTLEDTDVVRLRPLGGDAPEPTVGYYGIA